MIFYTCNSNWEKNFKQVKESVKIISFQPVKPVTVAEWLAYLTALWEVKSGILPLLKRACGEVTGCHVGRVTPEVKLREHTSCMPPPSANKAVHSSFRTCRQKSKTGVSVAPQKGPMSSKHFQKKFSSQLVKSYHYILLIKSVWDQWK